MAGEPGAARARGLGRVAWKVLRYLLIALLALPVVFAALFLAIQEASERQWLGRAPEHPAIDVRSDQPHTVQLLDVGFDSLAERLRLIDGAERTIELEFFIYELDEASRLVTQALARKAAEGVQVRLLVDFALPVFKLAPAYVRALHEAGVEVRYYNTKGLARFFAAQHRTHRKLLVADRERAIVGGRNIGNDYFDLSTHYNFLDSDLLIDGPVAASIADSFDLYWASDWVTDPGVLGQAAKALTDDRLLGPLDAQETALMATLRGHRSALPPSTCADLQFVTDYPGSGVERRRVYPTIARLVDEARRDVLVESPYLVLRGDGIELMRRFTQQGVQLTFLTNTLHSTDAFYTVASLADSLGRLAVPGVQVWGYQGAPLPSALAKGRPPASQRWGVHAKRAVIDESTVIIGTYNMDPRSANLNSELIVVCRGDATLAAQVRQSIRARLAQSVPITGTPGAGGYAALVDGADGASILKMKLVTPLASWLDFLL